VGAGVGSPGQLKSVGEMSDSVHTWSCIQLRLALTRL
jgi:hypothetical protein